MEAVGFVEVAESGLDDTGAEEDGVGHYGCAEDAAGEVDAVAFDDGGGGEVALEDFAGGGVLDVGELDAEADHDAEDHAHDEVLEEAETGHAAVCAVEEEE